MDQVISLCKEWVKRQIYRDGIKDFHTALLRTIAINPHVDFDETLRVIYRGCFEFEMDKVKEQEDMSIPCECTEIKPGTTSQAEQKEVFETIGDYCRYMAKYIVQKDNIRELDKAKTRLMELDPELETDCATIECFPKIFAEALLKY